MSTKIKINKSQINYQKLRQLFYDRVFADGGTYEGDDELVEILNKENTQGLKLLITPTAYKAESFYSVLPNTSPGDFSFVQNTTNSTRINEQGLIETVPANTPRITWQNNIPLILVETERTCISLNSEDISAGNYILSNSIVSANTIASPTGQITMDTITNTTGNLGTIISAPLVPNDNLTRTSSLFCKKTSVDKFTVFGLRYQGGSPSGTSLQFNTKTGDFITPTGIGGFFGNTAIESGVKDYGDYWRLYLTYANNLSGNNQIYSFIQPSRGTSLGNYTIVNGSLDIWGWNITEGNLSSYIPTGGVTATRNADTYSVTVPTGVTEIQEYLSNGSVNTITTIPTTYTPAPGLYKYILMK